MLGQLNIELNEIFGLSPWK